MGVTARGASAGGGGPRARGRALRRAAPGFLAAALLAFAAGPGRAAEPVSLGETIGPEIDAVERDRYRLLPDVEGFDSARILRLSPDHYRIEYTTREGGELRRRRAEISAEAFELTRWHVELVDAFERSGAALPGDAAPAEAPAESEVLRALALRYAAAVRYEAAAVIAGDLRSRFGGTEAGRWAQEFGPRIEGLRGAKRALIRPGALRRQEGRTELLIFSGYYGLWLGVATPVALEADSRESIAAGLLLGGPSAILLTHYLTRDENVSRGRSAIIALGGHLATGQGLGWAGVDDARGRDVVAAGELAGLAGIAGAVALTHAVDFTEGHAEITASGMPWGAWLGVVIGAVAGDTDDELLRDALIGSDLVVLGAGVAGRGSEASRTRVRLVNLAGVVGAVFGWGVDLLAHVDDVETAIGIAGLGSVAGAAAGVALTRNIDRGREFSFAPRDGERGSVTLSGIGLAPEVGLRRPASDPSRTMPAVSVRATF